MKIIIVLGILAMLLSMAFNYKKTKDIQKLLFSFLSMLGIILLAIAGNITRQVVPLFLVHSVLILAAWIALSVYVVQDKYYWWIIFSPLVTIGLFVILEVLMGSAHEGI